MGEREAVGSGGPTTDGGETNWSGGEPVEEVVIDPLDLNFVYSSWQPPGVHWTDPAAKRTAAAAEKVRVCDACHCKENPRYELIWTGSDVGEGCQKCFWSL